MSKNSLKTSMVSFISFGGTSCLITCLSAIAVAICFINQSRDWLMTPNLAWNYLFEKTNLIKKRTQTIIEDWEGVKKKKRDLWTWKNPNSLLAFSICWMVFDRFWSDALLRSITGMVVHRGIMDFPGLVSGGNM